MAIAYYIPDQSKLLEGGSAGSAASSGANSGSGNPHQQSNRPVTSTGPAASNVIANIKIPLNPFTLNTMSCWDLIANVFCYALRFCHQSSSNNGIIQISLEFSNHPQSQSQSQSQCQGTTDSQFNHMNHPNHN